MLFKPLIHALFVESNPAIPKIVGAYTVTPAMPTHSFYTTVSVSLTTQRGSANGSIVNDIPG